MFQIQKLNSISKDKLKLFKKELYEIKEESDNPDGVILRSYNMLSWDFNDNLKAIARAGAGVNNIPIDKCTEKGIVVFNTPGANANGVKELVLASLFLSSRKIVEGINWVHSIKGQCDDTTKFIEKSKSKFQGPEIKGKKLGVIGLGAIGAMVANDAIALGMEVAGYDPFISIDAAWSLSRHVEKETNLEKLLSTCDYITLHVPLNKDTKGMINKEKFAAMKKGVKIINLARGGLVVKEDLLNALEGGKVSCYVTDFPEEELLCHENVIPIPHLGASTLESEENCADMAIRQLRDFLERGVIKNSVNFPDCDLDLSHNGNTRIIVANINVPNIIGQITTILANNSLNISDMINRHRGNLGYNIIDLEGGLTSDVIASIRNIKGVIMVRLIYCNGSHGNVCQ